METFFLKSVFVGVRKSRLQGGSVAEKQFHKTSPGPGVTMFRKKLQGQEGEGS